MMSFLICKLIRTFKFYANMQLKNYTKSHNMYKADNTVTHLCKKKLKE